MSRRRLRHQRFAALRNPHRAQADVVIMERATRIFTCSGSICGNTNLIERLCGYTWALSVRVCSVANKCTDSQTVEGIQMPPCSCPIKRETCEVGAWLVHARRALPRGRWAAAAPSLGGGCPEPGNNSRASG